MLFLDLSSRVLSDELLGSYAQKTTILIQNCVRDNNRVMTVYSPPPKLALFPRPSNEISVSPLGHATYRPQPQAFDR